MCRKCTRLLLRVCLAPQSVCLSTRFSDFFKIDNYKHRRTIEEGTVTTYCSFFIFASEANCKFQCEPMACRMRALARFDLYRKAGVWEIFRDPLGSVAQESCKSLHRWVAIITSLYQCKGRCNAIIKCYGRGIFQKHAMYAIHSPKFWTLTLAILACDK